MGCAYWEKAPCLLLKKKSGAVSKDRLFSLPQLRRMLEVLMRVTIRHNQRLIRMEVSLSYTNYCLNLLPSNPNNLYGWKLFLEASYSIICIDQMQGGSLKKKKMICPDTETQSQSQWPGSPVTASWSASGIEWVIHARDLYICGTVQISSGPPWPLRCALYCIIPGRIRTHNLQIRSLLHYPIMLQEHIPPMGLEPILDGF